MAADDVPIGFADRAQRGFVGTLVGEVPSHAHDVLRPRSCLREHGDHIFQSLLHLASEIVSLELASSVPPDLSGDEHQLTTRGDPIRVATRARPAWGLKDVHISL